MKKQIEHILLSLLWLLAATLGTSFWLNTTFGFNIFSAQHWQYLSYMQAARQPVRQSFYISLTLCLILTLTGFYILMHPRIRIMRRSKARPAPTTTMVQQPAPQQPNITPTPAATPPAATPATDTTKKAATTTRPPRLNIPHIDTPPMPPITSAPAHQDATPQDIAALQQIFADAGYTVKKPAKIGTFKPNLLAIGTDEVLYLGAIGASGVALQTARQKLLAVFNDTLDDVQIHVHAFVVAPTAHATGNDIMTFESLDDLREYMTMHTNPPLPNNNNEDFDAYSEYIDTVMNYVDKI